MARVKRELNVALEQSNQRLSVIPHAESEVLPGTSADFHNAEIRSLRREIDRLSTLLKEQRVMADASERERKKWCALAKQVLETIAPLSVEGASGGDEAEPKPDTKDGRKSSPVQSATTSQSVGTGACSTGRAPDPKDRSMEVNGRLGPRPDGSSKSEGCATELVQSPQPLGRNATQDPSDEAAQRTIITKAARYDEMGNTRESEERLGDAQGSDSDGEEMPGDEDEMAREARQRRNWVLHQNQTNRRDMKKEQQKDNAESSSHIFTHPQRRNNIIEASAEPRDQRSREMSREESELPTIETLLQQRGITQISSTKLSTTAGIEARKEQEKALNTGNKKSKDSIECPQVSGVSTPSAKRRHCPDNANQGVPSKRPCIQTIQTALSLNARSKPQDIPASSNVRAGATDWDKVPKGPAHHSVLAPSKSEEERPQNVIPVSYPNTINLHPPSHQPQTQPSLPQQRRLVATARLAMRNPPQYGRMHYEAKVQQTRRWSTEKRFREIEMPPEPQAKVDAFLRDCTCSKLPDYFRDAKYSKPSLTTWPRDKARLLFHCGQIMNCKGHPSVTIRACRDIYDAEVPKSSVSWFTSRSPREKPR